MKTFGSTLTAAREKRKLSLSQLAELTHVPEDMLLALENEQASVLPADALVQGYVQLCAQALDVPAPTLLALYRRDVQPVKGSTNGVRPSRLKTAALLQPRTFSTAALAALVLVAAVFLARQWRVLGQPPSLEIIAPEHQSVVSSPVTVLGQAEPGTTVTLNTELVSLDPEGNFRSTVVLSPGERTLVFEAKDGQGRTARKLLFITVVDQ